MQAQSKSRFGFWLFSLRVISEKMVCFLVRLKVRVRNERVKNKNTREGDIIGKKVNNVVV